MRNETAANRAWLLAIDTSTEQAGLALTDGEQIAESTWRAGRDQTVSVLAQIDRLIDLAGITVRDLAVIAVASGPGMFNGLRVGMSVAKGFHLGIESALIGVSTFDITAYQWRAAGLPVAAVIAAGRGRLVWRLEPGANRPVNGTVDELAAVIGSLPAGVMIAGDLTDDQARRLTGIPGAIIPPRAARARRPAVLAEIGWLRFLSGEIDDPIMLSPVYVHGTSSPAR